MRPTACAIMLFCKCHFVKKVVGFADLVDGEEDIADVEGNVAADLRIKDDVTHCAFPNAVEIDSDEVAFGIDHRAS